MSAGAPNEDGNAGFQIAPMVDVVFVLMLFFMACAGMQVSELELSMNLPGHGKGPIVSLNIDIAPDGQVAINNELYGTPADRELQPLRAKLRALIEQFGTDDLVIIRPTGEARHERIMHVLSAAAAAGVKKLTFG